MDHSEGTEESRHFTKETFPTHFEGNTHPSQFIPDTVVVSSEAVCRHTRQKRLPDGRVDKVEGELPQAPQ